MNRGTRACRYGTACRNPGCPFEHSYNPVAALPASSLGPCRYGTSCRRTDCKYLHAPQVPAYQNQYAPSNSLPLCRFGSSCYSPDCRFDHPQAQLGDSYDDAPEFTPEEEEFMDEILGMIEQEKMEREAGGGPDSDDERNIDEILNYIEQQPSQTVFESEYISQEEAEAEYNAMVAHEHNQQREVEGLYSGLNRLNIKGMSAAAKPFVPRSVS